jgi:hypothetical protein
MGRISTHRLDGFEDCTGVRKIAGFELGMQSVPIYDDLKCAPPRRHQGERFDILFQSQKFLRQTDGFGLVISNRAILDDDFHGHWYLTLKFRFDLRRTGNIHRLASR